MVSGSSTNLLLGKTQTSTLLPDFSTVNMVPRESLVTGMSSTLHETFTVDSSETDLVGKQDQSRRFSGGF